MFEAMCALISKDKLLEKAPPVINWEDVIEYIGVATARNRLPPE